MGTGSFSGLKRPGHVADHSSPSSADVTLSLLLSSVPAQASHEVTLLYYVWTKIIPFIGYSKHVHVHQADAS